MKYEQESELSQDKALDIEETLIIVAFLLHAFAPEFLAELAELQ
jgi:hypothetical protein